MRTPELNLSESARLFERAHASEPGGLGGNARGSLWGFEPHPIFMARGSGAYLEDVDGNRYIDFLAAWGPLILGHRPPKVIEAVTKVLHEMGSDLGFCHRLEFEAAEMVVDAVPAWDQVRFASTGSEAVMSALRIARAYTGRSRVLRFEGHFHGWTDLINFSSKPDIANAGPDDAPRPVPASAGMVEILGQTLVVRQWNDAEILEQTFAEHGSELAAVICEPILANASVIPPEPGYLELMRELTIKHGVVLIFDEVKTGFRVARGGAQELLGVTPDLSTAAKALGGGFPIAAVGGRRELFEPVAKGLVGQGSTYQANPMVLAAAIATLHELNAPGFFDEVSALGERLVSGLSGLAEGAGVTAYARGVGPIFQIVFADHYVANYRDLMRSSNQDAYRSFWRSLVNSGVMFNPHITECWFVSAAHTQDEVTATLAVAQEAFERLAQSNEGGSSE
ncbi:MAG: aspartate aminotransferase family protein [Candidatus Dormibacteria bacterium]